MILENGIRGFPTLFLDNFFNLDFLPTHSVTPKVDVKDEDKEFILKIVLAGIPKENIKLNVDDGCLYVNAENKECDCKDCDCKIEKSFILPDNIDIEKINAKYENGILNIILPKLVKEDKRKLIEIQ